eukprot:4989087-Amphidinium_carterae.4
MTICTLPVVAFGISVSSAANRRTQTNSWKFSANIPKRYSVGRVLERTSRSPVSGHRTVCQLSPNWKRDPRIGSCGPNHVESVYIAVWRVLVCIQPNTSCAGHVSCAGWLRSLGPLLDDTVYGRRYHWRENRALGLNFILRLAVVFSHLSTLTCLQPE